MDLVAGYLLWCCTEKQKHCLSPSKHTQKEEQLLLEAMDLGMKLSLETRCVWRNLCAEFSWFFIHSLLPKDKYIARMDTEILDLGGI